MVYVVMRFDIYENRDVCHRVYTEEEAAKKYCEKMNNEFACYNFRYEAAPLF